MKEKKKRNKLIRKEYKLGQGGKIGKAQNPPISRQRVFQIRQKEEPSLWGRLWHKLHR